MRKLFAFLLIFSLLLPAISAPVAALEEKLEVKICTVIDIGYHDVWKHTDGRWQHTGKPGDTDVIHGKNNEFEIQLPEEFRGKYKNLRAIVRQGLIDETDKKMLENTLNTIYPELYNGPALGMDWLFMYRSKQPKILDAWVDSIDSHLYIKRKINLLQIIDAVSLHKEDDRNSYNITIDNSRLAASAEGYRWYIPTVIDWYGVEDDKSVDLQARLDRSKQPQGKIGQNVTLKGWVKNLGSVEQVTDYTWWLPDTSKYDPNPNNLKRYKTISVTLGPGEEKEVALQYKIPDTEFTERANAIKYRLEVNSFKDKPADEPNWVNNFPGPMSIRIIKPEPELEQPSTGGGLRPPILVE